MTNRLLTSVGEKLHWCLRVEKDEALLNRHGMQATKIPQIFMCSTLPHYQVLFKSVRILRSCIFAGLPICLWVNTMKGWKAMK